jgi:hypothetical protein
MYKTVNKRLLQFVKARDGYAVRTDHPLPLSGLVLCSKHNAIQPVLSTGIGCTVHQLMR